MHYREAIKDAQLRLTQAKAVKNQNVFNIEKQLKDAERVLSQHEKTLQQAYDKEFLIAECSGIFLYPDEIRHGDTRIRLTSDTTVSLAQGGDVIYGGFQGNSRVTTADLKHADTRAIYLTVSTPEKRFTVQGKPEDELLAYHFVDAVYNTTKCLDELAREKADKLARFQGKFDVLDAQRAEVEKIRTALALAKTDDDAILAAQYNLDCLRNAALHAGLDKNGRTAGQRKLFWFAVITIAVAILLTVVVLSIWAQALGEFSAQMVRN